MKTETDNQPVGFLDGLSNAPFTGKGIHYDAMNHLQPVVDKLRKDAAKMASTLDKTEKLLCAHFATPSTPEGRLALAAMNEIRAVLQSK